MLVALYILGYLLGALLTIFVLSYFEVMGANDILGWSLFWPMVWVLLGAASVLYALFALGERVRRLGVSCRRAKKN